MRKAIDRIAAKMGADIVGTVPEYSAGAFGVAKLARALRDQMEPSLGRRPGRPTNPRWSKRSKVPLAPETEDRLKQLARLLSDERRKVSPMQVAGQLLEDAAASFFAPSSRPRKTFRG